MNTDISFYCDYDAIKVIYSTERDKERKEKKQQNRKITTKILYFWGGEKGKQEAIFSNKKDSNSGFGICMVSLIQRIKETFEISGFYIFVN